MQRIGIVYREDPPAAAALATRIESLLAQDHIMTWKETAERSRDFLPETPTTDLVIVLGGDGTIISTARQCARANIPLLGINFGHVGFLAELAPSEVEEQLPAYLAGESWIDERAMLQSSLDVGNQHEDFLALNDIVLVRGCNPRIIRFKLWVDDCYYSTMTADGVIVATATGSTAYNMAAGGSVLHPNVRGCILTPVAPHLKTDPPLVLEEKSIVRLELLGHATDAILSADGQINRPVPEGASITITTSPLVTRFLRRRPHSHFYQVLNAKLSERT